MKKWLLAFLLLGASVGGAAAARLVEEAARIGYRAPSFEARNLEGSKVKLADFKGRVVLINFWASWCAPCVAEFPDLAKLQSALPATQFTVVALSQDSEMEDVAGFIKKHPVDFPVLMDEDQKISRAYKIRGLPVTFLVGPDGVIAEQVLGPRDWSKKEWVTEIKKLAAKKESPSGAPPGDPSRKL